MHSPPRREWGRRRRGAKAGSTKAARVRYVVPLVAVAVAILCYVTLLHALSHEAIGEDLETPRKAYDRGAVRKPSRAAPGARSGWDDDDDAKDDVAAADDDDDDKGGGRGKAFDAAKANLRFAPAWSDERLPPFYDDGSGEPIIVGLEQCEAFRASSTKKRRPAPAGLFNTGTNLLTLLLRANCRMAHECPGRDTPLRLQHPERPYVSQFNIEMEFRASFGRSCAPFFSQTVWGKHNPVDVYKNHTAIMYRDYRGSDGALEKAVGPRGRAELLPVVVTKDPLTWMKSMCRMPYVARFRHGQAQCCPNPVTKTSTVVAWQRGDKPRRYSSLPKLWSEWNRAYYDADFPRLMVRYEDLLWRAEATTTKVCDCVGGTMLPNFDPVTRSSKAGEGHGTGQVNDRATAAAKYANESRRYEFLDDADVAYVAAEIDPRLVDAFGYEASASRRAAATAKAPACVNDEAAFYASFGLKRRGGNPGGRLVPLDDEYEGMVLYNNILYSNVDLERKLNAAGIVRDERTKLFVPEDRKSKGVEFNGKLYTPPPRIFKDEHDCVVVNGFRWCEALQECIRSWLTPCPKQPSPSPTRRRKRDPSDVFAKARAIMSRDRRTARRRRAP